MQPKLQIKVMKSFILQKCNKVVVNGFNQKIDIFFILVHTNLDYYCRCLR